MRSYIISMALAASLMVSGCATTPSQHMTEGKALLGLWSAYGAAASSLDSLAVNGSLTPTEKAIIAVDNPKIVAALNAAQVAYDGNDNATAAQNVATATSLITDLVGIANLHGQNLRNP